MISAMTRFEVVGPKELLWDTLDALQDTSACHLDPAPLTVEGSDTRLTRPQLTPDDQAFRAECGELATQYAALLAELPSYVYQHEEDIAATADSLERRPRDELTSLATSRITEWQRLKARADNLLEDQKLYQRYRRILDGLDSLRVHPTSVVIPLLVDDGLDRKDLLEQVEALCAKSRVPVESNEQKLGSGAYLLALAVPADHEPEVREYLWEQNVSEAVFPQEYADLPPLKIRDKIEDRLEAIPQELEDVQFELEGYAQDFGVELVAIGHILAETRDRYDAYLKASLSDYVFQLVGWAPIEDVKDVKEELARVDGESIQFQKVTAHDDDLPPTRLSNPGFARPFETMVGLFPPPMQGSVDPTVFCFFTLPLFFGWMVGDAGYGFCMLLIALVVRLKWGAKNAAVKDVSYIFGACALSAMIFGVLFGEYFGHLGVYVATKLQLPIHGLNPNDPWHGHVHLWIGRTEPYLPKYLALSVLVGVIHMGVSLMLGIYTAYSHYRHAVEHDDQHHAEHAFQHGLEKIAMFLGLIGFVSIALGGLIPDLAETGKNWPLGQNTGLALVAFSIGILMYALPGAAMKATAPIEGVAVLSNTISYARLMAVGVAGVVLAQLANDVGRLADPSAIQGLSGGLFAGACALGAVLLHLLALGIAIFDPMIQALRLHYVEFFSKFFEAGGAEYTPLARKGGSSL